MEAMNTPVDYLTDRGNLLSKLLTKHSAPAYVQEELKHDKTAAEKAPPGAYASYVGSPRFPCHTKAATWLSHAYYLDQRENFDTDQRERIENNLAKFAYHWDIADDVAALCAREVEVCLSKLSYDTTIPVRSPEETKAASSWLTTNAREISAEEGISKVAKMAGDVLASAERHGIELPSKEHVYLQKLAGKLGCCNGRKVAAAIKCSGKCKDKETMNELTRELETKVGEELQALHLKIAEACEALGIFEELPQIAVAPDDMRPIKLANEAIIYPDDAERLKPQDWLQIEKIDLDLGGVPQDLTKLDKTSAEKLCQLIETRGGQCLYWARPSLRTTVLAAG